jgi:hypothetical protein
MFNLATTAVGTAAGGTVGSAAGLPGSLFGMAAGGLIGSMVPDLIEIFGFNPVTRFRDHFILADGGKPGNAAFALSRPSSIPHLSEALQALAGSLPILRRERVSLDPSLDLEI